MRVSTTALVSAYLLASCATSPPMERGDAANYVRDGFRDPAPTRHDSAAPRSTAHAREANFQDGPGNYTPRARGRFALLLGGRSLGEDAFAPTDSPGVFAVEFSQVPDFGGLGFEFGLNLGFDEENGASLPNNTTADLELRQAEFYAGVRAEYLAGPVRPYIGGGVTSLSTTTTIKQGSLRTEEDDSVLGLYLHGGIQADINDVLFLGLDYRHVFAEDYEIGASSFAADFDQISLVLGFNL